MVAYGADPDALDRLAATTLDAATALDHAVAVLAARLSPSPWIGPRADRFLADWHGHRAVTSAAAAGLRDAAAMLRQNATDQRDASSSTATTGLLGLGLGGLVGSFGRGGLQTLPEWRQSGHTSIGPMLTVSRHGASDSGGVNRGGDVDAYAGAQASANEHAEVGLSGITAGVGLMGVVGAGASAQGSVSTWGVTGAGKAEVFTGARADAESEGSVSLSGIDQSGGAQVFVGGEADASASVSAFGAQASGDAEISYGLGAHVHEDVHVGYDKMTIGGDIGGTLGLGVGIKGSISFSPKHLVDDIGSFL